MNNYVDNVYLINMDKDTDRLEKVKKECDKVDIKFERFPKVKVSDVSQNILDKYISEGFSHLFVWQDAIKKNYKNILVLEDDVYFTDDFNEYLQNVMEELPDDYDILYLGNCELLCQKTKHCNLNYIYKPILPCALHGYIVSNKGLKKLVKLITKVDGYNDKLVANNIDKLNIYATKKKIVNQLLIKTKKPFPKIINYCLDKVNDYNDIPKSYNYDYFITRMSYSIFNLGVLANIHDSILLLCLLYFAYDYDRFHLIVFLLGYFIGNILKYTLNYCKVNQYAVLFSFILLIIFLNITNIPFIVIKTLV